ncbi:MAG TPA: hemolysin III family protein [Alphaproteobacteria bacterium]|nr:hemolysin III family protein [Alphaproteobacteria bacterium]
MTAEIPVRVDDSVLAATLIFSVAAMALLLRSAIGSADRRQAIAVVVYGTTLVACALCSFLYQTVARARWRRILRYLDHAAIFLLIAGTYTPFASDDLRGPFGLSLLVWVWALASLGLMLKLLLLGAYDRIFVGLYVGIGWFVVVSLSESIRVIGPVSLALLIVGGIAYTAGAIVYARNNSRWTAPIWHSCVLAGCLTHFLAVIAHIWTGSA